MFFPRKMGLRNVFCATLLAGLVVATYGGLTSEDTFTSLPNPWRPSIGKKCLITPKNGCNGNRDCCKGQFCFRCPFCDNVFTRPGSCISVNGPIPGCAPPPPCEIVCPEKSCKTSSDCCPFQTCLKCPTCAGPTLSLSNIPTGKCVDLKKATLTASPICPLPPLPPCEPAKCEGSKDCGREEFCFRCAKCEGRNGPMFTAPGTCLSLKGPIPGCPAPGPCDGILLQPALAEDSP